MTTPVPRLFTLEPAPPPFFLIAGPCALDQNLVVNDAIALELLRLREKFGIPVIFKGSFDKANRAHGHSPRGVGLDRGLQILERIMQMGCPTMTDIHEPHQAAPASEVCRALQIPAFLCRQTDLVTAAAATGLPVNIKKGQWATLNDMQGAVDKVYAAHHAARCAVTERGTFFGYGDLVVDMRNIPRMQRRLNTPVIFDASHSVQQPGSGLGGISGGLRGLLTPLTRAAVACGANGLFVEVHPTPETSPSDRDTILPLSKLEDLLREILIYALAPN